MSSPRSYFASSVFLPPIPIPLSFPSRLCRIMPRLPVAGSRTSPLVPLSSTSSAPNPHLAVGPLSRARWQREGAASGQKGSCWNGGRPWRVLVLMQARRRRARRVLRAGRIVAVELVEADADRLKETATLGTRRGIGRCIHILCTSHTLTFVTSQIVGIEFFPCPSPSYVALPIRVCRSVLPLAYPVCVTNISYCCSICFI